MRTLGLQTTSGPSCLTYQSVPKQVMREETGGSPVGGWNSPLDTTRAIRSSQPKRRPFPHLLRSISDSRTPVK